MNMKDPYKHKQSFNRPNIHYSVKVKNSKTLSVEIPDIIKSRIKQSGIIYCLSKKDTETVSKALQEVVPELKNRITFYHADVAPEEKERRQRAWCKGDIRVIVATIAFGMGKIIRLYLIRHDTPFSYLVISQLPKISIIIFIFFCSVFLIQRY